MHNQVIQSAIWFTRITQVIVLLLFVLILGFVVYWHIAPERFDTWYLISPFRAGSATFFLQRSSSDVGLTLNELGKTNIYWLLIRTTFFTLLVIKALRLAIKILLSVRVAGTFYVDNIRHFKGLAVVGVVFALLSTFNFGILNGQTSFNLSIPFGPILFTAACYVMAEIFREGNRLQEDANSII